MSTFFVGTNQVNGNKIYITGEDFNHIKNVLRFKINDELDVCDDLLNRFKTKIVEFNKEEVVLEILSKARDNTEPSITIDLYQGLPKSDKMELIIQKNTELGVKAFIPVIMDRTIVKLNEDSASNKALRWQKIAKEAATQSGRQIIPTVEKPIILKNIIEKLSKYDIVIMPYECEKDCYIKTILKEAKPSAKNVAVIIGPEGGFSSEEVSLLGTLKNLKIASLGPRILRTETAGLVTCTMVLYELDN